MLFSQMILLIVGQESLFTPRLSLSFGHLLASDFLLWLLSLWFWWGLGVSIQVQQISEKGEWFFINPSSKVNPHTFIHLFCSFNKRHNKSTAHGTLMSMILDVTDFFFPSIHAFKEGMAKKKKKKGGHGNPLQYSCLENPHRQRSLVGYSP